MHLSAVCWLRVAAASLHRRQPSCCSSSRETAALAWHTFTHPHDVVQLYIIHALALNSIDLMDRYNLRLL